MAQRKIVTQIPWKYLNKLQLFTMEQLKTMMQVWFFNLFIRFLNVNKQQLRSLLDLIMLAIYFVFMINMLKFIFASLIHPSYNHSLACQSMLSKLSLLQFFSVYHFLGCLAHLLPHLSFSLSVLNRVVYLVHLSL